MRWLMTSTEVFTKAVAATVSAIFWRFESDASIQRPASMIAAVMARTVFGFCFTKSAVQPSTFSGWSFQMSCVVMPVMPMPSAIARWPHGSPTQKPSMLPTRMFATICGGGTTMAFTSLNGCMPFAASQ